MRVDTENFNSNIKSHLDNNQITYEIFHRLIPTCTLEMFQRIKKNALESNNFPNRAKELRDNIQKNSYSICFCENCDNEVLWLKYAENHRGFVIEYSICDEILENEWKSYYKANLLPIHYSNEAYEDSHFFAYKLACPAVANSIASPMLVSIMQQDNICWESVKMSTIKKVCHKEDREWRLVPLDTLEKREFVTWQPKSVTIGLRTPEYKKRMIISAAQVAWISEFYQMIINERDEFVRAPLKI